MRDYYCSYEAEMTAEAVQGSLVDRRWRGEMDVRAANTADAHVANCPKEWKPTHRMPILPAPEGL